LSIGIVARIVVIITVVRIIIPVVWVIIPKGISNKEMSLVPEMLSVPEITFVPRKVRSLVLCEAMAGKTMPRKAMPGKPSEMAAATTEMATASTMATASSTMCERGGGRERQNAGQNQTDK